MSDKTKEFAKEHVAECPVHGPYPAHYPRCPRCR